MQALRRTLLDKVAVAYAEAQRQVAARWQDRHAWWRSSVMNTAKMGWFSSDRTIREYAEEIWGVKVAAH